MPVLRSYRVRPQTLGLILALAAGVTLAPGPSLAQETVTIEMRDFSFEPHEQIVRAGTVVRWLNRDDFPHSVAVQGGRPGSSPGLIDPGKEHSFAFREAGRFLYRCGVHPTMLGEVIVQGP